eukprot:CAMPEP_0202448346 /NCGR_PEP_ID=MMETSP1360-20130828/7162_1 /ASSEMBLY_ACC=CAM_ASM_000848 /TAXON_ID=515479 /ORGANISM="Licmophora paradoxa, Strain CCMP2313" /LENGTH=278 /DNA_ID=CAMNT_0049065869 /DNA_START=150 /DNA_END=986 /DNA_ORIENTATION=-
MADVQYWDDELAKEIDEIQNLLDRIPGIVQDKEKAAAFDKIEEKLKAANNTKKTFKMETRLISDMKQRKQYEKRLTRLGEDLSHLKADLTAMKQDFERDNLIGGAHHDSDVEYDEEEGQKAGDQMLGEASKIQEKTQDSLDVTKQLIEESKEVGLSSLEELKRQRETLGRIDKEMDRVDGALGQAEKLIKQFGKRMASDRFIQCFAVINSLLLVGVIIFVIFFNDSSDSDSSSSASPSSPVTSTTSSDTTSNRYLRGTFVQTVAEMVLSSVVGDASNE